MAKAHVTTKAGTKVTIEGSDDEVAALISKLEGSSRASNAGKRARRTTSRRPGDSPRPSATALVGELIDGGFFKKPKELGAIKTALEEIGHFYPVTTLSPIVLRLVRNRSLRRIKDKTRWTYVA